MVVAVVEAVSVVVVVEAQTVVDVSAAVELVFLADSGSC